MPTSVLLSIRPVFASKIFDGTKKYEYRRTLFKNRDIKTVIVYATAPTSKVIGEFEVSGFLSMPKDELWNKTKNFSGISKEYFYQYFSHREMSYAIKIGRVCLYSSPRDLGKDFNIKHAPQSYIYIPH